MLLDSAAEDMLQHGCLHAPDQELHVHAGSPELIGVCVVKAENLL